MLVYANNVSTINKYIITKYSSSSQRLNLHKSSELGISEDERND